MSATLLPVFYGAFTYTEDNCKLFLRNTQPITNCFNFRIRILKYARGIFLAQHDSIHFLNALKEFTKHFFIHLHHLSTKALNWAI